MCVLAEATMYDGQALTRDGVCVRQEPEMSLARYLKEEKLEKNAYTS